jgi:hypothetical protein
MFLLNRSKEYKYKKGEIGEANNTLFVAFRLKEMIY